MIVFALNIMPSSSINDNKRITKCHNNRNYNTSHVLKINKNKQLVGGFNPSEKYESKWESSPIFRVKIKK